MHFRVAAGLTCLGDVRAKQDRSASNAELSIQDRKAVTGNNVARLLPVTRLVGAPSYLKRKIAGGRRWGVVDLQEISEASERLVADGRPVSVRAVRASLKAGGSFRDIGRLVAQWKADRKYIRRVLVDDVPLAIQNRFGDALAALWNEARMMAMREHDDDRESWKEKIRANDEIRDEALTETDRLTDEVRSLRGEVSRLRVSVDGRDARLARVRSEEFWDRVMMEIREILPATGSMTVEDILPRLRETVHREAANHKEKVTPAILRKKMLTRVTHGRYFEASDDGAFARRRSVHS